MILRDYQQKASDSAWTDLTEASSTLVVMPTGCGKTILFADLIRRFNAAGCRAMVLAHREELIFQAADKIKRVTGLSVGVEMADYRLTPGLLQSYPVVVSTVQTQTAGGDGAGRMAKFDPKDYGLLIIDEAHHATADSYRRVINYYRNNPSLRVLGVTATPDRADEEALGQVFDTVAFDYEILDAINGGWLVPIEQQMVQVAGLDYSHIKTTAGDLNGRELADVLTAESMLQSIAAPTIEILGSKRALLFAAGVKQAERLAEIFNRHRVGMAKFICGETETDMRRETLRDFAAGKIQILCNCGVLTEGFDDAGDAGSPLQAIIMARPTKSRSLYAQMVGRGTRPLPGLVDAFVSPEDRVAAIAASVKPSMLVVDFVGNAGRHKLMSSADILGGNTSDAVVDRAIQKAMQSGKPMRMDRAFAEVQEEMEIEKRRLEEEERKRKEVASRNRLVARATYSTVSVSPFDVFRLEPVVDRGWDKNKVLTEKQDGLLRRQGIDPATLSYASAKKLIGEIIFRFNNNLCSYKQAKILAKHGYDTNVEFKQASAIIDTLAKNGWRRPMGDAR
jgi:superfamily II DNA or RNA helicase